MKTTDIIVFLVDVHTMITGIRQLTTLEDYLERTFIYGGGRRGWCRGPFNLEYVLISITYVHHSKEIVKVGGEILDRLICFIPA